MSDFWFYIAIFLLGGITTLLEEAAKTPKSIFNKKVLGFLPIKHIFTAIAVVLCIVSFVLYYVNGANKGISLLIVFIAMGLLVLVIVIDIFILLGKRNK